MKIILELDFSDYDGKVTKYGKKSSSLSELSTKAAKLNVFHYMNYFSCYNTEQLKAATITIGLLYLKTKSIEEQYTIIKKQIQDGLRHTGCKYIFFPEVQPKSGHIHFHGLVSNELYERKYFDIFGRIGKRNMDRESFKRLSNFNSYWKYITKDHRPYDRHFKIVSNVKKNDFPDDYRWFDVEDSAPPAGLNTTGATPPRIIKPEL